MHFKFDQKIYNTDIVKTISCNQTNLCLSEGIPVESVTFLFLDKAEERPLTIKVDSVSLGQFFYDWKHGKGFFEFYIDDFITEEEFKEKLHKLVNSSEE